MSFEKGATMAIRDAFRIYIKRSALKTFRANNLVFAPIFFHKRFIRPSKYKLIACRRNS